MPTPATLLHIDRLHPEPRNMQRTLRWLDMLAEVKRLQGSLETAREEIRFLTSERDALVQALRSWARPEEEAA